MEIYEHSMLLSDGFKERKSLKIINGVNPKKYIQKYGEYIEEIEIDDFYGKFWHHCKNLKKITIGSIAHCRIPFFLQSVPKTIEVIVLPNYLISKSIIKNFKESSIFGYGWWNKELVRMDLVTEKKVKVN
jgi:hypothetical protein